MLRKVVVGPYQANCYILGFKGTNDAMVIDPGDDVFRIVREISAHKLTVRFIVITHGHFDHVMGLLEVKLNFNIPILIHEADKFLLESLQSRAQHWLKRKVDPAPPANSYLTDNQILLPQSLILNCLYTPGHTPGSVSYYFPALKSLFSGDTLTQEPVNTSHKYSSLADLTHSHLVLKSLPPSTIVYPGHGQSFAIPPKEK